MTAFERSGNAIPTTVARALMEGEYLCQTLKVSPPIHPGEFGGSDDHGRKREEFPSLSMMSRPITPAPPRLRPFPGIHGMTWRCRVDLADICRHKRITPSRLKREHYDACLATGWGDTEERAYNAWKSSWRSLNEPGAA